MNQDEELAALRDRLKHGEYDGGDIMQAWIAIDALIAARREIVRLQTIPAVPESAIRAVWEHGYRVGDFDRYMNIANSADTAWPHDADEVARIFAEALKRG